MTNYNERLDEILYCLYNHAYIESNKPVLLNENVAHITNARQALTSLIKELVAEAKPCRETIIDKWNKDRVDEVKATNAAMNAWADIYEQNLLKALEEV